MLGRTTTTTKPLLKDLNLGATEMQSIGLCRKWTAVAIKEENLPHCSVAHERVARKIITCFMKETVENVVIFEGCLGWRLDVVQGDAAWRGRAGLCVPAGPWDGEKVGPAGFFGPASFPPTLVRSPGHPLCCHCQVIWPDCSSRGPIPPRCPLMCGGLGCLCAPWLVLHINSFEGWETLKKSTRRRKQVHVFNPFCSLVIQEKSLQMSLCLCKMRNTRGMESALRRVSLEATAMSQLPKERPGGAETALRPCEFGKGWGKYTKHPIRAACS